MSEFRFSCPKCRKDILCDTTYSNRQINCPVCGELIVVPKAMSKAGGSGALKKVLMVVVVLVVLGALGGGGWYFYKKHQDKVTAAAGNPAAQVGVPDAKAQAGAMDVLTKMTTAYSSLTSLKTRGTAAITVDMSGVTPEDMNPNPKNKNANRRAPNMPKSVSMNADVSMKLAKPDQYLIEASSKMSAGPMMMTNTTVTWTAGGTNYALMLMNGGSYKNFTTAKDRNQALMMNGQSGAMVLGIPQLFFDETGQMGKFITEWGQTADDAVSGQDCYTLTGKMMGQKLKLWVSKESYLILQSEITLGGVVSDADVDAAISIFNTDTKMTKAQLDQMKMQAKQAAMMVAKIKGTITETYESYEVNSKLSASDFMYTVPRGTRLVPGMM